MHASDNSAKDLSMIYVTVFIVYPDHSQ